jgi:enoyl-[acyl-carrier protein] reductase I
MRYVSVNAPLQQKLTAEEVGQAAAFLTSPLASGITGTIIYVDKGFHTMGKATEERYSAP